MDTSPAADPGAAPMDPAAPTILDGWPGGPLGFRQRSIRYHRPRAPFCGRGDCTGCLVRVNGRPNVRACQYRPGPNDRIETENAWPSPRFDLGRIFDLLFPRGIDTTRGLLRPSAARPLYQRVVRRLAGYGRFPTPTVPSPPSAARRLEVEVTIVGAGACGRAVAARLALESPGPTVILDRTDTGPGPAGALRLYRTTAAFLPPPSATRERPFTLWAVGPDGEGLRIDTRHVVVATGGYDANLLFGNGDLPGVLTADGALALAPGADRPPFREAVVVGGGARAAEVIDRWGEWIGAVVAPGSIEPEVVARAAAHAIPLFPRTLLLRARGFGRVTGVDLAGRGSGPTFHRRTDAVILALRRLPNAQLFFQAGARLLWHPRPGGYFPRLTDGGESSIPGLWGVGDVAGDPPEDPIADGVRVAEAILGHRPSGEARPLPRWEPTELEGYVVELAARRRSRGKWVACACEDVLLHEVEEAVRRGYHGIEAVKRYTGLGTGLCQGRYCLPDALLWLSVLEHRPVPEIGYITQRPPVVPTPLGAWAGLPEPEEESS
ncbi:MAG: 2Fe-2S iron-sulfur cluster-binding protein [Thermoplasmata archaeon]|jgi:sarcosine oxidase subunit alpha